MTDFVVAPPPIPSIPVAGGGMFPVRRIFCVGRNYAAHAREMGADPTREPPFFFTKPADALIAAAEIAYPPATRSLHYEMELVVALATGGIDIAQDAALDHVFGYAAGVDLTRRDMQDEAKSMRRPWDMSKGFDQSAPVSPIVRASQIGHPTDAAISLSVDGTMRQTSNIANMIWSVPEMIAFLSRLVTLQTGDIIFTGTPEGVGAVERGSTVTGTIDGVAELNFRLV